MNISKEIEKLSWLRNSIIGRNVSVHTPFGDKPLVYADYTASGRGVDFIEQYMQYLMQYYANTHTEDDFTGKVMTQILHESESKIKHFVNAGDHGKIVFSGTGATGGIMRLQQILGLYWSPATEKRVMEFLNSCRQRSERNVCYMALINYIQEHRPIIFVGPYEHHSNEIMWRHTICDIVEIPLNKEGYLDLVALEETVSDERWNGRMKIGSFSAASNVSGVKTPVYDVARILHRNNALACFDFAACAPYVEINMNLDDEAYFDAIYLSPHKFLGGPGSSGLLIFNEQIYPNDLPPSVSAGGTVDYVGYNEESFISDIETREKPGTPGILQAIKAALVFDLKDRIGEKAIEEIEYFYLKKFYDTFQNDHRVIWYGPTDPKQKINIIPFNIKHNDRILHPKFVTKLLNDLFGIQTRAGCSCAGPYGHRLLNISEIHSRKYNKLITERKYSGVKPGWVRLNFHYSLSEEEFDYIVNAIHFVLENAWKFLSVYEFDFFTGEWTHINENGSSGIFGPDLDLILRNRDKIKNILCRDSIEMVDDIFAKAIEIANQTTGPSEFQKYESEIEDLMFFYVSNVGRM